MKKEIIDILKAYWSTKPNNHDNKNKSQESLHVLEDGASGVQVGDIKQVIVWNMIILH